MKKLIAKAQEDSTVFMLLIAVVFLLGAVAGFMYAPIKKGFKVTVGSNNRIVKKDDEDDDWGCFDDDGEDENH